MRAAQWLRERRLEVAALEVRECAKPWPEADADVCEAIDFLEYYARGAVDLAQGAPLLQVPGRAQRAALRAARRRRGDLAVELPARDPARDDRRRRWRPATPRCSSPPSRRPAARWCSSRALREAGVPPSALALLPGEGEVGAALVRDPRVHTIAFTGSNAVGLEIVRAGRRDAARPAAPQARDRRDGRQELRDRRLRRRPRRGRPGARQVRVPVRGPEVLGRRPRARATRRSTTRCSSAWRARSRCSRSARPSDLEIDVPPVIEQEAQERVARYAAEAERGGRIAARARDVPGRRLVRRADARRRPARRLAGAQRGDLRPAAGGRARAQRRRGAATASTPRRSRSPAACSPATRTPSTT